MVFKLVSTKGGHAWLDASCSQGDEYQTHHGQRSEKRTHTPCQARMCSCGRSLTLVNSHVEGHVVRGAVLVGICDVMDGTHCQDDLAHRVNDGQVNNSPVHGGENER